MCCPGPQLLVVVAETARNAVRVRSAPAEGFFHITLFVQPVRQNGYETDATT